MKISISILLPLAFILDFIYFLSNLCGKIFWFQIFTEVFVCPMSLRKDFKKDTFSLLKW